MGMMNNDIWGIRNVRVNCRRDDSVSNKSGRKSLYYFCLGGSTGGAHLTIPDDQF
jgi:hypothetical protein